MGLVASVGAVLLAPNTAEACGGTFCDGGGPVPMPVDQSGENIVFIRDGDNIEAHIQIQYQGEAAKFGWVIPLQSLPEFSVGSEPFFQALLAGTVPTYLVNVQRDDCSLGDEGGNGLPPGDGAGGTSGAADDGGDSSGGDSGPEVILQQTVGAYDIAVLQGGTAAEVIQWLDDNGYAQDEEAEPILQAYLDEGHLFGAVKLTGGADVDEIHPIVLRFRGSEPCIPLRLTRIAALEDMDIRSFFLGSARTVPQNYRHVLVNQVKIDWTQGNLAQNYKEVITQAVDAPMAVGRAFVTEYAGTSDVVPRFGISSPSWNSSAFVGIDPIGVVDALISQGLYFCDLDFGQGCNGTHPLVQPLLDEFLPVPDGVDRDAFYECLSCFSEQIDLMAWDDVAFAAAMEARIVVPGQHAVQLLDANPYLTRMYTTMSPGEMTEDPMFHENAELPEVPNNLQATQRILCNGDSVYILPDGRQVYLPAGAPWPDFDDEPAWSMPSDEEVQEVMSAGAPVVLVNNTQAIDDALAAYNQAQGWAGAGEDGGSDGGADDQSGGSGCGCRTGGSGYGGLMLMLLGLGAGLAARRRERSA
ncbi:MAG: DUF2330 domain-containing protein [Myxococcales bacterium]|nr:DUF2330 domain-containing protein [Myxococcales bacterium]